MDAQGTPGVSTRPLPLRRFAAVARTDRTAVEAVATETAADETIVSRISAGDPAALGELYDRYGGIVFGVLYRLLGAREPAQEVTQDAFHAVWRSAATYRRDRGSVRTWVLAIARNGAIDWRRTTGKRLERESRIEEAAQLVEQQGVPDRVIERLRAERVRAAVMSLSDEQRAVLSLAFWSGLSQSEIAERTGAPLGTVKSRVRLGMAKLRQQLRRDLDVV